jgi:hypothetical protein
MICRDCELPALHGSRRCIEHHQAHEDQVAANRKAYWQRYYRRVIRKKLGHVRVNRTKPGEVSARAVRVVVGCCKRVRARVERITKRWPNTASREAP